MKRTIILFLVCVLQVSCSSSVTPSAEPAAPVAPQNTSAPVPVSTETFEVIAWISDTNPQSGERVILYGHLLKEGVYLGGMAMHAIWPDEDHERGVPNCSVLVTYGRGVCIVETEGFPSGVYVPITVSFEYLGNIYSGQTGFTPE